MQCFGRVCVDDKNCLTPESRPFKHSHPQADFDSNKDDPIPAPKIISLPRVNRVKGERAKYQRLLELLSILDGAASKWKMKARTAYENMVYLKKMVHKLETYGTVGIDTRKPILFDAEIRITETKYFLERIKMVKFDEVKSNDRDDEMDSEA